RRILRLLYLREALSKQDIASQLKLSLPTVTQNLKQLLEDGLTDESGNLQSSGGRRPRLISFNYNARVAVGAEISGTHARLAIVNLKAGLVAEKKLVRSFANTEAYWLELRKDIDAFISENKIPEDRILGLGMAFPGTVPDNGGKVEFAPTLELKNLRIDDIRKHFRMSVLIENEANAACFAEAWSMEKRSDLVYLSITKGVGGAILIRDRIFRGENSRSGEFGHMTLKHGGRLCSCGRKGCFEAYCSVNNLTSRSGGSLEEFFNMLERGDAEISAAWKEYLEFFETGILNLRMVFDSDIVIGGDIAEHMGNRLDEIRKGLGKKNLYEDTRDYLKLGNFGHNASAAGAALLHIDNFLKE
ncbi:MAG: ROK family transcriptional regulator, partial [Clostridiales bacterium]|nr:ROK family transcriptional regulator [Clostridiales bacterium]